MVRNFNSKSQLNPAKQKLRRLLLIQAVIAVVVAICAFLLAGFLEAYSALLGGGICAITNYFFAKKLFAYAGASKARNIVTSMYVGEAIKIILTAVLFLLVFHWVTVAPLPLFIGFIATQFGIWLAPWVL